MEGKALAEVSKTLRKRQTPWESELWYFLRGGRFYNLKFKRQVPMGDYVVDFCCQEKKLIIELDGGHHNQKENRTSDRVRQNFLESKGYKVLRFWNNEFAKNIQGVLEVIRRATINN
ncbi:MAG: endonuclease domain-containing protein [Candidatus Doudnabacteria bacterium]|jgi:very-short-patch-repair endonuclease